MSLTVARMLWFALCMATLAVAMWRDVAERRIPNRVVVFGAACGLLLAALPFGVGLGNAAAGMALGLVAFLPMYAFRTLGAGDVKLLVALGAFAGFPGVMNVVLYTLVAGGALAVAWAFYLGQLMGLPVRGAHMPYSIALAAGMAGHVLLDAQWLP